MERPSKIAADRVKLICKRWGARCLAKTRIFQQYPFVPI